MDRPLEITRRVQFLNFFRNIFRFRPLEYLLSNFTRNKGYDNFFVKCIPQNYQYPSSSFRTVKRDGIRFRLDLSEYMEWVVFWGLNVEDRSDLYALVKKNWCIFDIGTNIGETLLNFAMRTGSDGFVYGFEPVRKNYEKSLFNIDLNEFRNVNVLSFALSDKEETLYFRPASNFNSGGIFMNKINIPDGEKVEAITLDRFTLERGLTSLDFIKLDVEGFEYNILKGGVETIRRFHPVLFIEVDQENLNRQNASVKELYDFLYSLDYIIRRVQKKAIESDNCLHYDIIATYNRL